MNEEFNRKMISLFKRRTAKWHRSVPDRVEELRIIAYSCNADFECMMERWYKLVNIYVKEYEKTSAVNSYRSAWQHYKGFAKIMKNISRIPLHNMRNTPENISDEHRAIQIMLNFPRTDGADLVEHCLHCVDRAPNQLICPHIKLDTTNLDKLHAVLNVKTNGPVALREVGLPFVNGLMKSVPHNLIAQIINLSTNENNKSENDSKNATPNDDPENQKNNSVNDNPEKQKNQVNNSQNDIQEIKNINIFIYNRGNQSINLLNNIPNINQRNQSINSQSYNQRNQSINSQTPLNNQRNQTHNQGNRNNKRRNNKKKNRKKNKQNVKNIQNNNQKNQNISQAKDSQDNENRKLNQNDNQENQNVSIINASQNDIQEEHPDLMNESKISTIHDNSEVAASQEDFDQDSNCETSPENSDHENDCEEVTSQESFDQGTYCEPSQENDSKVAADHENFDLESNSEIAASPDNFDQESNCEIGAIPKKIDQETNCKASQENSDHESNCEIGVIPEIFDLEGNSEVAVDQENFDLESNSELAADREISDHERNCEEASQENFKVATSQESFDQENNSDVAPSQDNFNLESNSEVAANPGNIDQESIYKASPVNSDLESTFEVAASQESFDQGNNSEVAASPEKSQVAADQDNFNLESNSENIDLESNYEETPENSDQESNSEVTADQEYSEVAASEESFDQGNNSELAANQENSDQDNNCEVAAVQENVTQQSNIALYEFLGNIELELVEDQQIIQLISENKEIPVAEQITEQQYIDEQNQYYIDQLVENIMQNGIQINPQPEENPNPENNEDDDQLYEDDNGNEHFDANTPDPNPPTKSNKNKKPKKPKYYKIEKKLMHAIHYASTKIIDNDYHFLLSMLQHMKDIPMESKLEVKIQILTTLFVQQHNREQENLHNENSEIPQTVENPTEDQTVNPTSRTTTQTKSKQPKKPKKYDLNEDYYKMTQQQYDIIAELSRHIMNNDYHFLLSLLEHMKRVPREQKIDIKIQLMTILQLEQQSRNYREHLMKVEQPKQNIENETFNEVEGDLEEEEEEETSFQEQPNYATQPSSVQVENEVPVFTAEYDGQVERFYALPETVFGKVQGFLKTHIDFCNSQNV